VIEPIHEAVLPKVDKPTSSDNRQPPPRRQPQPRRDSVPAPKVYGPNGNIESEENQPHPKIDLVG
jgi:hypothetical protein